MSSNYLIGEFCSFAKGASVPRDRMFGAGSRKYLHYGDLYKGHELYIDIEKPTKPIPFISEEERVKPNQFVSDGDIIYVLTSETIDDLGKALMVKGGEGEEIVAGTETTVMRVENREIADPAYINYMLQTELFKRKLRQYVTGMKVFRVHPRDIAKIEVSLPDIETQNRVVCVLDAIYEKRSTITHLNDYLADLCDALFSEFVATSQDDTWHEGTLEELLEVKYGKDHKKLADGPYPVYGSGGFMRSVEKPLSTGESVLIPRKGSLNNVMYVDEEFWTVDTMFYTVPRIPGAAKYAYQHVKMLDLASMNSGSAVPSMTTNILNALSLPIPSEEALASFDAKLQPMYDLIKANNHESTRLAELRDALLPKLMSGEIDVSGIDLTQLNNHFV